MTGLMPEHHLYNWEDHNFVSCISFNSLSHQFEVRLFILWHPRLQTIYDDFDLKPHLSWNSHKVYKFLYKYISIDSMKSWKHFTSIGAFKESWQKSILIWEYLIVLLIAWHICLLWYWLEQDFSSRSKMKYT